MVQDVQDTIATALGGQTVTTTVEGRQRFTVNMRYPARPPRQSARRSPATSWCRCRAAAPCRSARSPRVDAGARADLDPHRERAARDLHLCRHPRPRSRRLRRRRADARCRPASSFRRATYVMWSGQYEYLERADRAAEDRRAGDAADHLPAALPQLPLDHRDHDRDAVAAVRAGRRALADVVARLQPVGRGRRRLHRARRRRRRDRRGDADLSRTRRWPRSARAAHARRPRARRATTSTTPSWKARSSACARR